jgi:primosomal protein N'
VIFLSEEKVLHHKFKCTLCGTNIELPLCCKNGTYRIEEGKLNCDMCGSEESVPICCDMQANYEGKE